MLFDPKIDGVPALILELIEGETLEDRLVIGFRLREVPRSVTAEQAWSLGPEAFSLSLARVFARSVSWAGDSQSIYAAVAELETDVVLFDGLMD